MNRLLYVALFQLLFAGIVSAQPAADTVAIPVADSLLLQDTAVIKKSLPVPGATSSVLKRPANDSDWIKSPGISFSSPQFSWELLKHHPYFDVKIKQSTLSRADQKKFYGKEWLFYLLVFLLIVFGLLRKAFPKYFGDLFRLFFRTTMKQRQIKEQMTQTPLPSLLLNVFFVISGGLYITFLFRHFKLDPVDNFWLLFLYSCLGLSAAYFVKFIGLKVSGWLFNMTEVVDSYIFIVFIINKMIGILLLPFLVLLAFAVRDVYTIGLTISWCLVAGLLAYRFILTYAAVRNQVKVNPFHFFLYFCAFEIAPLLLVYKGLLLFFGLTA